MNMHERMDKLVIGLGNLVCALDKGKHKSLEIEEAKLQNFLRSSVFHTSVLMNGWKRLSGNKDT